MTVLLRKDWKTDDPGSYCCIDLLHTLAKVVEKLVKVKLMSYLNKHNFLNMIVRLSVQQWYGRTGNIIFNFREHVYKGLNVRDIAAAVLLSSESI